MTAAFGFVVIGMAVAALVTASRTLSRSLVTPVLPAAAVTAVGLPAVAVFRPDTALHNLPAFVVGLVLATFLLLVVSGRRADVTAVAGLTCLLGLVVGVGATALILLRGGEDGVRWTAAVVLLAGGPELSAAIARSAGVRVSASAVRVAVAATVVAGVVLTSSPLLAASLAAIGALTLIGGELARVLRTTLGRSPSAAVAGRSADERRVAPAVDATVGTLLSAPGVLLLAEAVHR